MDVTVTVHKDEFSRERTTLANVPFGFSPSDRSVLQIDKHPFQVGSDHRLYLTATFAVANQNMAVFVTTEKETIFFGSCHWNEVAPSFAFRLQDGHFVELYFEK